MYKFLSLLSLFLIFQSSHSFSKEIFDWNTKYSIQVENSEWAGFMYYSINITVKEKKTKKTIAIFQEEGLPLDFFVKKLAKQELFFYTIHSGGESGGITTLRYLILKDGKIENHLVLDSPALFKFVDVDKDGNDEIITQNLQFEWFEVEENCSIIGFYFEYFEIPEYFVPRILTFENHRFVDNTFKFKKYIQEQYLALLEKELEREEYEKNYIAGFIQYFFVSSKLGMTKKALAFIKRHNKPFQHYHCQDNKSVNTTVFDFIKKYRREMVSPVGLEPTTNRL